MIQNFKTIIEFHFNMSSFKEISSDVLEILPKQGFFTASLDKKNIPVQKRKMK